MAGPRYDWGYYALSLLMVQNWGFTDQLGWNVPAWSISTEWFAYLIFPLLWEAGRRFSRPWLAGVAMAVVLAVLAGVGHASGGLGGDIARAGLARCVLEFSLGILVFVMTRQVRFIPGNRLLALAVLAGAAMPVLDIADYWVAPLAAVLLTAALLDGRGLGARAMNTTALVWLGEISYSTYLVHFFVRDWVKFLVVTPGASTTAAFALYIALVLMASPVLFHLVEQPGRRMLRSMLLSGPRFRLTLRPRHARGSG